MEQSNGQETKTSEHSDERERKIRLRKQVLSEIISSEEAYISQLDLLLNVSLPLILHVLKLQLILISMESYRGFFVLSERKISCQKTVSQRFLVTSNLFTH